MDIPLVDVIGFGCHWKIDGKLPSGLVYVLKREGLKHSLDGGDVLRDRNREVEIRISSVNGRCYGGLFDSHKNPGIDVTSSSCDNALPYITAIETFLRGKDVAYHYSNYNN